MPDPKLLAVITVLFTLGSGSIASAAYTLDQLREIERLITSKDCSALRGFIDSNPALLDGADPLAAELRSFANGFDSGLIGCLAARPAPVPRVARDASALQY